MNDSMNDRSAPAIDQAVQSDARVPDPAAVRVLSASDMAERHGAVCAGAVKYLPDLRAFARSLSSSRHQADDLVQGAIVRALGAAHQFTPGTNIKAWLFTILRNVCFNQWRSPSSRQLALDDCVGYMPVTGPEQEANLEFCDFRRAFAQLVPEQREALMLVGASGLDYKEAAEICGCAVGTVKSRVSRARAIVKSLMDGGGALSLRRQDLVAISTMDIAFALDGSGAALHQRAQAL
jgi:RNA polymerase sigma-70 factor (ECF subfamily)